MQTDQLKNFLDNRDIDTVVFDIDNTLLITTPYYDRKTDEITIEIGKLLNRDSFLKEFYEVLDHSHTLGKSKIPTLVDDWYIEALNEYYNGSTPTELVNKVREFFKDFYDFVPPPHEYAIDILQTFIKLDRKIVLHSHAQERWTSMKANMLSGLVGVQLPYLSTPMTQPKDKESWIKAFSIVGSEPDKGLVVGDNWVSDIQPSIEAGSKNLVWIDRYDQEEDLDKYDADIYKIREIREILDILN